MLVLGLDSRCLQGGCGRKRELEGSRQGAPFLHCLHLRATVWLLRPPCQPSGAQIDAAAWGGPAAIVPGGPFLADPHPQAMELEPRAHQKQPPFATVAQGPEAW